MQGSKNTKKFAFLLAVLAISRLTAQTATAFHDYYESAGSFARCGSNLIFNSFSILNSFTNKCFVSGLQNGSFSFRNTVSKHETTVIADMIRTFENRIVYIGSAHGCDYSDTTQLNFISCLDTLGNYIFDRSYKDSATMNWMWIDGYKQIRQYPDSSFFVITDSSLCHLDKSGILLSQKKIPFGTTAFCITQKNSFVLTRWNYQGPIQICEIDSAGTLLKQDTTSFTFSKIVCRGAYYYGLTTTGYIFRYDSSLKLITSSQVAQGTRKINDFSLINDTLFCAAFHANGTLSFLTLDTGLMIVQSFDAGYSNVSPQKILCSEGSVFLLNDENNIPDHNPAISVLELFKSNLQHKVSRDIGVVQMQLDSAYTTTFTTGTVSVVTYFTNYYRMNVWIRNFGSDTVRSFVLNHKPSASPICGVVYYSQYFPLTLAPGQVIKVTTPFITSDGGACQCPAPTANYPVTIPSACFWTSVPDNQCEKDHSNDELCATVTYTATVGVQELARMAGPLKVYPNPFEGHIIVEAGDLLPKEIFVYSIHGAMLRKLKSAGSLRIVIPTQELPAGAYFVVLRTQSGELQTACIVK